MTARIATDAVAARFWPKVDKRGPGECWVWNACRDRHGYGMFGVGGRAGGNARAHRVSYELSVGPIPDGLVIDHLCRNRACVNPQHLEPVTMRTNILRGEAASALRESKAAITHCPAGHPYSPENTIYRKGTGWRRCRECSRAEARERMRRRRVASDTGEILGDQP